jgi:site-specific DNA-methyltransferase (adenine-specific)
MLLLPTFAATPRTNNDALVNIIHHTDLLTLCAAIAPQSVDMILCDLPYGTTACAWDTVIPFEPMWAAFKRVIKPRGAIVLTASQPFTSALVMSNPTRFKYSWVWDKGNPTGHLNASVMPLRRHEDICVFGDAGLNYYPQMSAYEKPRIVNAGPHQSEGGDGHSVYGKRDRGMPRLATERYPVSLIYAPIGDRSLIVHPTQKPVALFDYLIRTYTQPGELVFDPTCGSGTTAVAARQIGRHFICGDTSAEYVEVARKRLAQPYTPNMFEVA